MILGEAVKVSHASKSPALSDVRTHSFRLSRAVLWVGLIGLILFTCFTFAAPLFWEKAVFIVIALLSVALLTAYCNLRIVLYRDTFSVRNVFRVIRTYSYAEITGIEQGFGAVRLYIGKRSVEINILYKGYPSVLILLAARYRSQSGGKGIPRLPERNSRFDLFSGHVRDAGVYTAVFAGITLMLVAVLVLGSVVYRRYETEEIKSEQVTFPTVRLSYDGDDLILHAAQNDWEYRILSCRETLADVESFLKACKAGTVFDVAFTLVGPKENKHKSIKSISADDAVYLDRRVMTEYLQKNMRIAMWFMGGLLLIWLGFCAGTVAVGRHPERYSYRTVRLFFKHGALKPGYTEKSPRTKKRKSG